MSTTKTPTDTPTEPRTEDLSPGGEGFSTELDEEFVPLVREISRRFKEKTTGVSAGALFILRQISMMERATARDVAKATHITTAGTSQLLAQLIDAGLVRRERSKKDRRIFNLVVTEKGVEVIEKNRAIHREILLRTFSCLDDSERVELVRLLHKVRRST